MILAIDVGNTNLVLALGSEAGSVDSVWRISTDAVTSADACRKAIRKTLGTKLEEVDNSVIASVVPAITRHVATAMEGVTGRAPLVIGESGVDLGIAVNIDRPEQAGADRVVNAVGAQVHHQLPAVILDFGTATTLDLVGATAPMRAASSRLASHFRSKLSSGRRHSCRSLSFGLWR